MSGLSYAEMGEGEVDMSWIELGYASKRSVLGSLLEYKNNEECGVPAACGYKKWLRALI